MNIASLTLLYPAPFDNLPTNLKSIQFYTPLTQSLKEQVVAPTCSFSAPPPAPQCRFCSGKPSSALLIPLSDRSLNLGCKVKLVPQRGGKQRRRVQVQVPPELQFLLKDIKKNLFFHVYFFQYHNFFYFIELSFEKRIITCCANSCFAQLLCK